MDRWLAWNGKQELMKRVVSGMKEVMLDDNPVLLHTDGEGES